MSRREYTSVLLKYTNLFINVLDLSHGALFIYYTNTVVLSDQHDILLGIEDEKMRYYKFVKYVRLNNTSFKLFVKTVKLCGQHHISRELYNMCDKSAFMGEYKFEYIRYPNKFNDMCHFNKQNKQLLGWQISNEELINMKTNQPPIISSPDYDLLLPEKTSNRIYLLLKRLTKRPESIFPIFINYLNKHHYNIYKTLII